MLASSPLRERVCLDHARPPSGRAGCRPKADAPERLRVVPLPAYACTTLSSRLEGVRSRLEAAVAVPNGTAPARESVLLWEAYAWTRAGPLELGRVRGVSSRPKLAALGLGLYGGRD